MGSPPAAGDRSLRLSRGAILGRPLFCEVASSGFSRSLGRQNLGRRLLSRADAIRHADSAIAVPRQGKTRQLLSQSLDSLHSLQMANIVLRHCAPPSVYASETRFRGQPKNLAKFFPHDSQDFFVWQFDNLLVAAASKKAAEQSAVCGSPMKKFIIDERCRQQPLAFTARDQETEARGQGGAHLLAETECDRDRRTV